ncbi:MAG: hypothetical protein AB7M12_12065 [Hyphomonadaceae bacterium]
MKIALGAALAALALAAAAPTLAHAQAACPALPAAAPAIPDGATAKQKDMTAAGKAMSAWVTKVNAHSDCERKKIEAERAANPTLAQYFDLQTKLKAIQDAPEVKAHLAKVDSFNTEMAGPAATAEKWEAATKVYNARIKK